MEETLIKIVGEMQQRAKTCATVAQDKTQEALTGASSDKDRNTQDAKDWMIKSKVWLEAEAVVRGWIPPSSHQTVASPARARYGAEEESEL